ncbi:MAG: cohesin domain-containing protein [Candidatus Sumerlaeia bacterium]|nr:cohesin domain-containing protein [Candidatus Sumerlaeia bacterium]
MKDKKFIVFLLMIITILPGFLFSQAVSVRLGEPSQTPAPGVTFSVPVYINTGDQPLGAYTFSLLFDPTLLYVVSIDSGIALQFDCSPQGCCV